MLNVRSELSKLNQSESSKSKWIVKVKVNPQIKGESSKPKVNHYSQNEFSKSKLILKDKVNPQSQSGLA